MKLHVHRCSQCPHEWECRGVDNEKAVCKVDVAAQVNGNGIYCNLCRHIEMARRYAGARGMRLVVRLSSRGQSNPKLERAIKRRSLKKDLLV